MTTSPRKDPPPGIADQPASLDIPHQLTALEIGLGSVNIIFMSILSGKLPENQQGRARPGSVFLFLLEPELADDDAEEEEIE